MDYVATSSETSQEMAMQICNSAGARLCTAAELSKEGKLTGTDFVGGPYGSGCGTNGKATWTEVPGQTATGSPSVVTNPGLVMNHQFAFFAKQIQYPPVGTPITDKDTCTGAISVALNYSKPLQTSDVKVINDATLPTGCLIQTGSNNTKTYAVNTATTTSGVCSSTNTCVVPYVLPKGGLLQKVANHTVTCGSNNSNCPVDTRYGCQDLHYMDGTTQKSTSAGTQCAIASSDAQAVCDAWDSCGGVV